MSTRSTCSTYAGKCSHMRARQLQCHQVFSHVDVRPTVSVIHVWGTHTQKCVPKLMKNQSRNFLMFEYYNSTWTDNCLRAWARAPRWHPTHVWGTHNQKCVPKLKQNQGKNFIFSVLVLEALVAHRLASVLTWGRASCGITKFMSEVHTFKSVYQNWCKIKAKIFSLVFEYYNSTWTGARPAATQN